MGFGSKRHLFRLLYMGPHTAVHVSGAAGDDADIVALRLGSEGGGGMGKWAA